jgi:hypothetical protein
MAGGGGGAPGGGTPGGGIDPHTHNWSNWTQTKAPTEEQDGSETRTCSNNPVHSETRPIAALNHTCNWGAWNVTTAATFIAAGEETKTCTLNASHKETRISPQLEIKTTNDWSTAKTQLNGKTGSYTLTINGSFGAAGSTAYTFGSTANGSSLHVTLKGSGKISLTSQGYLLLVAPSQMLVIDSASLTFEGLSTNNIFLIANIGTLELKNGTISGNTGGGVGIFGGSFIMNNGTITSNTTTKNEQGIPGDGGGVCVVDGTFTMNGGTISDNYNEYGKGGGVYVYYRATFTMTDGTISGNTTKVEGLPGNGGGVYNTGNFTMSGGTISGNIGSGVHVSGYTIDYTYPRIFRIVTGTIYGTNEPNAALRNDCALSNEGGKAEYGTFSGTTWNSSGSLSTTDNTIKMLNGVPQP